MAELRVSFLLPEPARRRAVFVTDYGLRGGRLLVGDAVVLEAKTAEELARGVSARLGTTDHVVLVRSAEDHDLRLWVDGVEAPREDRVRLRPSRAAWIHGWMALAGSGFGFVASWLYVLRAQASGDPWAMKMATHMAAWHLLLTLALFPASVWGQRAGIRAVQLTALAFFAIHLGIALANTGQEVRVEEGPWIALLNAASGLAFLAATLYGGRACRAMDPSTRHAAGEVV